MATEKITLRLSDRDPIEAEIISIMRGKADGRRAPWLREVLVAGYQAMRGVGIALPIGSGLVPAAPASSVNHQAPAVVSTPSVNETDPASTENTQGNEADAASKPEKPAAATRIGGGQKKKGGGAGALAGLTAYTER